MSHHNCAGCSWRNHGAPSIHRGPAPRGAHGRAMPRYQPGNGATVWSFVPRRRPPAPLCAPRACSDRGRPCVPRAAVVQQGPLLGSTSRAVFRSPLASGTRAYHALKTVVHGAPETLEWKLGFEDEGGKLSPWHDIPLFPPRKPGLLNFVVEIPRGTRAKLECGVKEPGNPIIQDTKKGKLR